MATRSPASTASWWGHLRISCSTFFPTWGGGELGGIEKGGYSVDGEAKIWRRMRYKYPLNHQFTVPTIIRCCTNLSGRGFFHCLHFRVKKLFRNLLVLGNVWRVIIYWWNIFLSCPLSWVSFHEVNFCYCLKSPTFLKQTPHPKIFVLMHILPHST